MSIAEMRRGDRIALISVVLVVIGGTMVALPHADVISQVGPVLATVSAADAFHPAAPVSIAAAHRETAAPGGTTIATRTSGGAASSSPTTAQPAIAPERPAPRTAVKPVDRTVVVTTVTAAARTSAAIPAVITVLFASENHPDGVRMTVVPHGLTATGQMWIPGPEEGIDNWADQVSWLNSPGYAAPFSTHGAVIIAGHINWKGTPGALSDLADYGANDIGKTITVTMTDGRVRSYRIVRGLSIDKAALAAESNQGPLHTAMFGQLGTYGPTAQPTEELRIISCGGEYDADARSYESNIILVARPVT